MLPLGGVSGQSADHIKQTQEFDRGMAANSLANCCALTSFVSVLPKRRWRRVSVL